MAQKTLRQFSAPSNSHIPTGLNNYQGTDGFEIKSGLVNMVRASPFCEKASEDAHAHLQNSLEVSSIINPFDCSHSLCLEKQRRGFTPTRKDSTHGMRAPMLFWSSTFWWPKLMPFGTGFPISNNSRTRQSRKPGNVFRITLQYAHTTSWKNGLSFRTSTMA